MFFEEPVTDDARKPKEAAGLKFSVYALAIITTLFGLLLIPLSALVGTSGLL